MQKNGMQQQLHHHETSSFVFTWDQLIIQGMASIKDLTLYQTSQLLS